MNASIFDAQEHKSWIIQLKETFQNAQIKAATKVNTDLLNYYWYLGKEIVHKQEVSNWGDALLEHVSKDLSAEFPEVKGFSRTNLFYIRKWFLFYQDVKVPQLVEFLSKDNNTGQIIPQLVGQIPWGHNREIITKCSAVEEAIYYVQQTIQNNWSRSVLLLQMESGV